MTMRSMPLSPSSADMNIGRNVFPCGSRSVQCCHENQRRGSYHVGLCIHWHEKTSKKDLILSFQNTKNNASNSSNSNPFVNKMKVLSCIPTKLWYNKLSCVLLLFTINVFYCQQFSLLCAIHKAFHRLISNIFGSSIDTARFYIGIKYNKTCLKSHTTTYNYDKARHMYMKH